MLTGSTSSIKALELCHAVFNFEHIQQNNLFLLFITLSMHLSAGLKIKSEKQLKCTLSSVFKTHVATCNMSN